MTALFAAAVGGLSPLELFELLVAACFASAVASWAATAWWMKRRWEAEVAAERADAGEPVAEWLALRCGFCGHWCKGEFTKDEVAEWLRVHRNATVGQNEGHTTTASTCPHPCGTPLATGGVVVRDRLYLVGEDGPVDVTPFAHHRRRNG